MALGLLAQGIAWLLLGQAASVQSPVIQDQPVAIRRSLTTKEEVKYRIDSAVSQVVTLPSGEEQKVTTTIQADALFTTGETISDGKLSFTLTISNLKVRSDPEQPTDAGDEKIRLRGQMDEQNMMTVDKLEGIDRGDQAMSALVARIAQGIGTFPSQTVKVGDHWTVSEQAAFIGGKRIEYELNYKGLDSTEDKKSYILWADSDVPVEVDLGAMDDDNPASKTGMVMKGKVHIEGQGSIDPSSGWLRTMNFETKAEITIDAPGAQGQIRITSDEIVKLDRQY